MKITRKKLEQLVETFIASADGKVRRVRGDDRDKKHPAADQILQRAMYISGKLNQAEIDRIRNTYHYGSRGTPKPFAFDMAHDFGAITGKERDDAAYDFDVATNPDFEKVKKRVGPLVGDPVDKGLLKTFLNYLYKKGILRPGYFHHSEITKMFKKMYSHEGAGTPGYHDYYSLGMVIDREDGFIDGFDPERFKL